MSNGPSTPGFHSPVDLVNEHYVRSRWYGFGYFLRCHGSLLPRSMLPAIFSGGVAAVLSMKILDPIFGWDLRTFFDDPFSIQMFAIVFGYLMISRMQTCYNRYWEGVGHVTNMYNKWLQCTAHALSFDRLHVRDLGPSAAAEPYCVHLLMLMTQLSTLAILKLHSGEPSEEDWALLGSEECKFSSKRRRDAKTRKADAARIRERALAAQVAAAKHPLRSITRRPPRSVINVEEDGKLFRAAELEMLHVAACPVHLTGHRIYRALTHRNRRRGWSAPPPVFARVYAELAEAMAEYDAALKLKLNPVPFGFVQLNAVLLLVAMWLVPVGIACFSSTVSMAIITSVVSVGGFTAMWLVANEMESPFGGGGNNIDLREFHRDFVSKLRDLSLFFPDDAWLLPENDEQYVDSPSAQSKPPSNHPAPASSHHSNLQAAAKPPPVHARHDSLFEYATATEASSYSNGQSGTKGRPPDARSRSQGAHSDGRRVAFQGGSDEGAAAGSNGGDAGGSRSGSASGGFVDGLMNVVRKFSCEAGMSSSSGESGSGSRSNSQPRQKPHRRRQDGSDPTANGGGGGDGGRTRTSDGHTRTRSSGGRSRSRGAPAPADAAVRVQQQWRQHHRSASSDKMFA